MTAVVIPYYAGAAGGAAASISSSTPSEGSAIGMVVFAAMLVSIAVIIEFVLPKLELLYRTILNIVWPPESIPITHPEMVAFYTMDSLVDADRDRAPPLQFPEPSTEPWCAVCEAPVSFAELEYHNSDGAAMSCNKCQGRMVANKEVTRWFDSEYNLVLEHPNK